MGTPERRTESGRTATTYDMAVRGHMGRRVGILALVALLGCDTGTATVDESEYQRGLADGLAEADALKARVDALDAADEAMGGRLGALEAVDEATGGRLDALEAAGPGLTEADVDAWATGRGIPSADDLAYLDGRLTVVESSFLSAADLDPYVTSDALAALAVRVTGVEDQLPELAPTGTIMSFGSGRAIPEGWLPCDGAPYSRFDFPALWDTIQTDWGAGNDAGTHFNVPDLRGRFLRGADEGTGRDPDAGTRTASATGGLTGDNVGTLQGDELASHSHAFHIRDAPDHSGDSENVDSNDDSDPRHIDGRTDPTGGAETRPKNAAVVFLIKT